MDRFTSNQERSDQWLILHILKYISPAKMLRFMTSVICNYPGVPHVAEAT